jgi:MFS family permease
VALPRDVTLLFAAALLRAAGVGLTGVLLGLYLAQAGFSATSIGLVIAAGMAGAVCATLAVTFRADRFGRRGTLAGLALLGAAGGAGLALTAHPAAVFAVAFAGMVNGIGRDRGAAFTLEQAVLPQLVGDARRTWAMAWYNVVLDAGHAVGALAATLPVLFRGWFALDVLASYRLVLWLYVVFQLVAFLFYLRMSPQAEVAPAPEAPPSAASQQTRRRVAGLAALFWLDGLGSGFLGSALLAYWFFERFGVAEQALGPLFFAVRLVNSVSYLAAARLARRIGLVNTMVFTHLPSSIFLLAIPLAPTFAWAVALFLLRECLVEMDVPARQSYVVAVVGPAERTYASGVTGLARLAAWAVGPSAAGWVMQHLALGAPLVFGAGLKIIYDVVLFFSFRSIRPPEEAPPPAGGGSG